MIKNDKVNIKNPLILLITALIWGFAFVAQSVGMDYVGPFTFNCVRNILGGLVLLPVIAIIGAIEKKDSQTNKINVKSDNKDLLTGGILCGISLMAASTFQQIGIMYTSVGKAGFLTALYIIIVPVLGLLFGKKCGSRVWIGVVFALIGFYFLCMTGGSLAVEKGDVYLVISAFLFAVQILVIDKYSPLVNCVKMSCIQFFVSGAVSGIFMLIFEGFNISGVIAAAVPILYAGIMSSGVAYTLQIIGQKNYNPAAASLIMSLESVFSALGGWLILHQTMSVREYAGCVVIFIAVILAQL